MDFQHSLTLVAPEIVLSLSGLVLLLAAAWLGDKASRGISIAGAIRERECWKSISAPPRARLQPARAPVRR